ncbi:F-box only protein 43 [Lepisosteus oculatus]|uniref:F-box only protein 43 n=1 Tax=Lepisosteus oculatus TaxID=7918 RepID=UPI0035F51036
MEQSFGSEALFQVSKRNLPGSSRDSGRREVLDALKMETAKTKEIIRKLLSGPCTSRLSDAGLPHACSSDAAKDDRLMDSHTSSGKERWKENSVSSLSCETPRVSKKDASLRRRLLMSKAASGGKGGYARTSRNKDLTSSSIPSIEEEYSFGRLDSPGPKCFEALVTSTLKAEEPASCRKRRLMFSQNRTSTLEDEKNAGLQPSVSEYPSPVLLGTDADLDESIISCFPDEYLAPELLETPCSEKLPGTAREDFKTPVHSLATNLSENLSVLSSPSLTPIVNFDASANEDSGFSSLGLDKSQDSLDDHDGSFQELLQPVRTRETPKLSETKRRSRLERHRRLSTLRERGSQSEEEVNNLDSAPQDAKSQFRGQKILISKEGDKLFLTETPRNKSTLRHEDFARTPALQMVHAICRRSVNRLPEQTSLEDLLGTSGGSELCKTTMPLEGLIGRKMGLEKVDILAELNLRNLRHVLAMILNLLSAEDIYRFGQVSDVWDEIVLQDKIIHRRRKSYLKDLKLAAEEGSAVRVPDAETRLNLLSRSALKSVQAQAKTPSSQTARSCKQPFTPVECNTAHSGSKQDEFIRVAKTLFNDESLRPCPRCQRPAKCHPVKKQGVCSQEACAFHFCTDCLSAFHGSKECGSRSAKRRPKKEVLPGSAQSKRNLKRL